MVEKSVAEKARVKPGTTIAIVNEVSRVVESLGLPDIAFVDPDSADIVFVFVHSRAELESLVPPAARSLRQGSALWVFFRKGSRAAGLDVGRDDVWALAENMGMRPLGLLSVDDSWSAFRLKNG